MAGTHCHDLDSRLRGNDFARKHTVASALDEPERMDVPARTDRDFVQIRAVYGSVCSERERSPARRTSGSVSVSWQSLPWFEDGKPLSKFSRGPEPRVSGRAADAGSATMNDLRILVNISERRSKDRGF
jgi:hypothetical protein